MLCHFIPLTLLVAQLLTAPAVWAQAPKLAPANPSPKSATPVKQEPVPVWRGPTPEQQAAIADMKRDVERITQQVTEAKVEDDKLIGGLVKAQIHLRIEIMRNTVALLEYRIKALETGARLVPVDVASVPPDPVVAESLERDIVAAKDKIAASKTQSDRYSGGLIKAQIDSTTATQEGTLAMLEQRQLMAKYGLTRTTLPSEQDLAQRKVGGGASALPAASSEKRAAATPPALADTILTVTLLSKRRIKQKYDEMIILDMDVAADGLDRPARAIKGMLKVTDLFGESRMNINWDFDSPVAPGGVIQQRDKGITYNQFNDRSRWLDSTEQQNMKVIFTVKSILYDDGTRRDF